jgi:TM2 domain-containing membrane protein YozV
MVNFTFGWRQKTTYQTGLKPESRIVRDYQKKQNMEAQKVDMFLLTYGKYFEGRMIPSIREQMIKMDDQKFLTIQSITFREPVLMLVISLLGGALGIDRFVIGDVGLGVGKLLTCGGLGIWTIVDWFMIMERTREVNFEKLRPFLM